MIVGIAQVALLVRDYEEAIEFYCGKLGFRVVEDTPGPKGKRWVRLQAPGKHGSELLLSRAVDPLQRSQTSSEAAGRVFLFLETDDLHSDCAHFRSLGIRITEAPRVEAYGQVAVFLDLYGNRIDLIQRTVDSAVPCQRQGQE